jgi:hypothetical protein
MILIFLHTTAMLEVDDPHGGKATGFSSNSLMPRKSEALLPKNAQVAVLGAFDPRSELRAYPPSVAPGQRPRSAVIVRVLTLYYRTRVVMNGPGPSSV